MTEDEGSKSKSSTLSPDRALVDPDDDRLGYAPFAKQLAASILRGCPADGLVVALYGAWGTGKSTALNFILHYLEQDPNDEPPVVVRFNPWWFAGQEDLVRRFFTQFEASIFKAKAGRRRFRKKLVAFSEALAGVPLPYVAGGAKAVKAALADSADVVALKEDLVRALISEPLRVVVVIDDVDRLASDEIRQLFQVIKAVADFPNVIYLLAFDYDAVVAALGLTSGTRGEDYLEKIVQVPFTLPLPERPQLEALLVERLNRLVANTSPALFDNQHWGNVYLDGIDPFIRKPRDIVRLSNALNVTYPAVEGEVNAVDFIAIETLRLFAPVAYEAIRSNPDLFAGTGEHGDKDQERSFHEEWLGRSGKDQGVVRKLIIRLFPRRLSVWGNTIHTSSSLKAWRETMRVCSPELFPIYFRLALPEGQIAVSTVRNILAVANDSDAFAGRLLALAHERRPDGHTRATSLLNRIRDFLGEGVSVESRVGIVVALFDVGDEIVRQGKQQTGGVDLGDEYRIGWVIRAALKDLTPELRASTLERAFESGHGVVTMVRELADLGHQHGKWKGEALAESERLVDAKTLERLERSLLNRIEAAGRDRSLWNTVRPIVLLDGWAMLGDADAMRAAVAEHIRENQALLAFISAFVTRFHSRALTDRVGKVTLRLDPSRVARFANVEEIERRVNDLRNAGEVAENHRAELDAFMHGVKARAAGKDPVSLRDWDDDD